MAHPALLIHQYERRLPLRTSVLRKTAGDFIGSLGAGACTLTGHGRYHGPIALGLMRLIWVQLRHSPLGFQSCTGIVGG